MYLRSVGNLKIAAVHGVTKSQTPLSNGTELRFVGSYKHRVGAKSISFVVIVLLSGLVLYHIKYMGLISDISVFKFLLPWVSNLPLEQFS